MKSNMKRKIAFASLFVGVMALMACNNSATPSDSKGASQGGADQSEAGGSSKKKSSSFVFSSVDEAALPDYEVKIVGADILYLQ